MLVEVMMIGIRREKYDVRRKESKDCGKYIEPKGKQAKKKEIVSYEKCLYESAIFFRLLLLKPLNQRGVERKK